MKIAQFIDTEAMGGAETLVLRLSASLKEAGHEVVLLHFNSEALGSHLRALGIPSITVPYYKLYKSIFTLPIFALLFRAFVRRHKFDVIHAHLFGPVTATGIALFAATWMRAIGTLHDTYIIAERPKRALLLRLALWGGTKLVTVAQSMCAYVSRESGIPQSAISVIYNGVSEPPRFDAKQIDSFRTELGLSPDAFVFCSVARLVPLKGHDILINAFLKLRDTASIHLLIVGSGECLDDLRNLTSHLNLTERIHFLGERQDVPQILSASNCFVLASHTEGLSCSIIEAMWSALPVIASNVGGNSELVRHGVSGYLFEDSNIAQLSQLMLQVITEPTSAKVMGERGSSIAQQSFSLSQMRDSYLRLYTVNS